MRKEREAMGPWMADEDNDNQTTGPTTKTDGTRTEPVVPPPSKG